MCWQAMGLGGLECVWKAWEWSPTWPEIMGIGGFDPSRDNRGAYAGWVHGIASRPQSKPKTPAACVTGGPPQPHPSNPRDAFVKALGAISPSLDMQSTVSSVRSSVDLGQTASAVVGKPSLEHLPTTSLEHTCLLFFFSGCQPAVVWSRPPRGAGGVARWGGGGVEASRGGHQVGLDVGE